MTVSLFHRMQVKDYDAWLNPNPEEVQQMMNEMGALSFSLHRNPEDPNAVMIYYQFPDESSVKSYVAFFDAHIERLEAASPHKPEKMEWWVGVDIPSHSNT